MSLNNRKPSVFTTAAFLYAGLTSFTKQAFERAAKAFDVKATQKKLDGQVFLVTGANSGIGKATTRDLLERGGTVHMACRSPDKAFRAREELLKDTGADPSKCLVHILDLSSVRQVKAFARHFARGVCGGRLDCLINNAGCMVHKREINDEGNEINFATNTLGTFVLTEELLPVLAKPDRQLTPSRSGFWERNYLRNIVSILRWIGLSPCHLEGHTIKNWTSMIFKRNRDLMMGRTYMLKTKGNKSH